MYTTIKYEENSDSYTLEELKSIRDHSYQILASVREKIAIKELEGFNFEGKFVKHEGGYMFVTWQHIDKSEPGNLKMFFQGLGFDSNLGAYRDSAYLNFDALHECYIPIESFMRAVKNGEFKEVTEEEVRNYIASEVAKLHNDIYSWIDYLKLDYTERNS